MVVKGRIHSLETLGTVDGPGIRTVIFFQGCSLRCRYCHNPDTWDRVGGKDWRLADLMKAIRRYRPYYDASGGGVTLSGGEPALQAEFAEELLAACRQEGIHTTLDTSGHMDSDTASKLLPHSDLVILDIKHLDAQRHVELTGRQLNPVLAFARQVSEGGVPLWIRQVLLPGWTDAPAQLEALAEFCLELESLERLELLPYHRLGIHKWETLGLPYLLPDIQPPTEADLKVAVNQLLRVDPFLPVV